MTQANQPKAPPRAGLTRAEAARLIETLQTARASLVRLRTRGGDEVPAVAEALTRARPALATLDEVAELIYSATPRD